MTVPTTSNKISYAATAGQDTFAYNFKVQTQTDMQIYFDDVLQAVGFSMTGLDDPAGGNVILDTPLGADTAVTLLRATDTKQSVDYSLFSAFPSETHESALDKAAMMSQDTNEILTRAIIAPVGGVGYEFPSPESDKLIKWNNAADGLENSTIDEAALVAVQANAAASADDAATEAGNAAASADDAATEAGNAATEAGNAATEAGNAASSAADAATEAGNAASSAADALAASLGGGFVATQQAVPSQLVDIASAVVWVNGQPVQVAGTSAIGGSLSANDRIDRHYWNIATQSYGILIGVESGSPLAPAYPDNVIPICQVYRDFSTGGVVTDSDITDERVMLNRSGGELTYLDTPTILVSRGLYLGGGTFETVTSASLSSVKAKKAIIRVSVRVQNTIGLEFIKVYLRKTSSGLAISDMTLVAEDREATGTATSKTVHATADVIVNLDVLYRFDWFFLSSSGGGTVSAELYLLGYYS